MSESVHLSKLLKRPEIGILDLLALEHVRRDERMAVLLADRESRERVEIEVKYEGYLKRQEEDIGRFEKHESVSIPNDFEFSRVGSLSKEGKERLEKVRPRSIGQAARISGVTRADISVLLVSLRKYNFT